MISLVKNLIEIDPIEVGDTWQRKPDQDVSVYTVKILKVSNEKIVYGTDNGYTFSMKQASFRSIFTKDIR